VALGVTGVDGLARSFLGGLEPSLTRTIRRAAVVHHFRSGDMIVSENDHDWTGILSSGMARIFLRTRGGRQVTLRHAQPGSSIGIGALLDGFGVAAQALTDCEVLRLDTRQVSRLAESHPSLAIAIGRELSARLGEVYREILIREQGSLRQRLARQLLHFAAVVDPERPLVLPMSHEEIADAVGSAREVVSRQLARFQDERMLALERGRITLVDPVRLDLTARQVD
jgi:CRP/FNR family transcriptional regulator